jgi:hypothetical protein
MTYDWFIQVQSGEAETEKVDGREMTSTRAV